LNLNDLRLDRGYTHADMKTKWFHHVRQRRATISFAKRHNFTKRTTSTFQYV